MSWFKSFSGSSKSPTKFYRIRRLTYDTGYRNTLLSQRIHTCSAKKTGLYFMLSITSYHVSVTFQIGKQSRTFIYFPLMSIIFICFQKCSLLFCLILLLKIWLSFAASSQKSCVLHWLQAFIYFLGMKAANSAVNAVKNCFTIQKNAWCTAPIVITHNIPKFLLKLL